MYTSQTALFARATKKHEMRLRKLQRRDATCFCFNYNCCAARAARPHRVQSRILTHIAPMGINNHRNQSPTTRKKLVNYAAPKVDRGDSKAHIYFQKDSTNRGIQFKHHTVSIGFREYFNFKISNVNLGRQFVRKLG